MNRRINTKSEIENEKIYNLKDLINEFSIDCGLTLEELKIIFENYEVIPYKEIAKYINNYKQEIFEYKHNKKTKINEVIKNRKVDYDYFNKSLSILSTKGLKYIEILEYISSLSNDIERKKEIENIIETLGIFHYGSIVKGSDIKRVLSKVNNTTIKFNDYYKKVNTLSTYNNQNISQLEVLFNEEIFPNKELIIENNLTMDDTSFKLYEIGHYQRKKIKRNK